MARLNPRCPARPRWRPHPRCPPSPRCRPGPRWRPRPRWRARLTHDAGHAEGGGHAEGARHARGARQAQNRLSRLVRSGSGLAAPDLAALRGIRPRTERGSGPFWRPRQVPLASAGRDWCVSVCGAGFGNAAIGAGLAPASPRRPRPAGLAPPASPRPRPAGLAPAEIGAYQSVDPVLGTRRAAPGTPRSMPAGTRRAAPATPRSMPAGTRRSTPGPRTPPASTSTGHDPRRPSHRGPRPGPAVHPCTTLAPTPLDTSTVASYGHPALDPSGSPEERRDPSK